jgi:signal transduction histidine kinase
VFLLLGAAIAGAFVILASAVYAPLQPDQSTVNLWLFFLLTLLPMAAVGLLPGIREVQVAGAQSLLGAEQVMVPEPMRAPHRWRTALWTFLHQVIGLVAGLLIIACALTVVTVPALLADNPVVGVPGFEVIRPGTGGGWLLLVGAAVLLLVACLGLVWAAGKGAAWSAPLLLGPSGEDRLVLAERRLEEERGYRRISRDLHDGVGHSLSAISLQAAGTRRVLDRAPGSPEVVRAAANLQSIEELAGRAVDELDRALAVLRDGASGSGGPVAERRPVGAVGAADLSRLDRLVSEHRSWGMDLDAEVTLDVATVPRVLSRTAYRVCAEALANAAKHGGPGEVRLRVLDEEGTVVVTVSSPLAGTGAATSGGRGLAGLRETIGMVGGSIDAGPVASQWTVRARLPRGGRRG